MEKRIWIKKMVALPVVLLVALPLMWVGMVGDVIFETLRDWAER